MVRYVVMVRKEKSLCNEYSGPDVLPRGMAAWFSSYGREQAAWHPPQEERHADELHQ